MYLTVFQEEIKRVKTSLEQDEKRLKLEFQAKEAQEERRHDSEMKVLNLEQKQQRVSLQLEKQTLETKRRQTSEDMDRDEAIIKLRKKQEKEWNKEDETWHNKYVAPVVKDMELARKRYRESLNKGLDKSSPKCFDKNKEKSLEENYRSEMKKLKERKLKAQQKYYKKMDKLEQTQQQKMKKLTSPYEEKMQNFKNLIEIENNKLETKLNEFIYLREQKMEQFDGAKTTRQNDLNNALAALKDVPRKLEMETKKIETALQQLQEPLYRQDKGKKINS